MVEWLGRQTLKSEGPGFKSRSDHYLELFLGSPKFNSSASFVNSQLVRLLLVSHAAVFSVVMQRSSPLLVGRKQGGGAFLPTVSGEETGGRSVA